MYLIESSVHFSFSPKENFPDAEDARPNPPASFFKKNLYFSLTPTLAFASNFSAQSLQTLLEKFLKRFETKLFDHSHHA